MLQDHHQTPSTLALSTLCTSSIMEADEAKLVIDSTIATGAITMPLWVTELQGWIGFAIAVGGLILVVLRIIIAIKDWQKGS